MNKSAFFLYAFLFTAHVFAQQTEIDSLRDVINSQIKDTAKIILLEQLGKAYREEKKLIPVFLLLNRL
jgi:hypothetical protein